MSRNRADDADEAQSAAAQAMGDARPSRLIDLPGRPGVKVRIVCPSEEDETEADVESRKRLTKSLGLSALELSLAQDTELAERERQIELITLCVRTADDVEEAFFEDSDEARRRLEKPQRKALIAAITEFQTSRYESRTPEQGAEIARLVRDLKEVGGLSGYWTSCGDDTKWNIVNALADALTPPNSSNT